MRNVGRLALGVIASALSVVPLYLIIGIFYGGLENDFLVLALLIAPQIALVGVILVGLPVHFIFRSLGIVRPGPYFSSGLAAAVLFVIVAHPFGEDGALWIAWQAILVGIFGGVVSIVFWKIVVGYKSA